MFVRDKRGYLIFDAVASASRRLILDSDDEQPLPPKPITEPQQRSNKKSYKPATSSKPLDNAPSSDDTSDSSDGGYSATGDNNNDLEEMEHHPEALIKALGNEVCTTFTGTFC